MEKTIKNIALDVHKNSILNLHDPKGEGYKQSAYFLHQQPMRKLKSRQLQEAPPQDRLFLTRPVFVVG